MVSIRTTMHMCYSLLICSIIVCGIRPWKGLSMWVIVKGKFTRKVLITDVGAYDSTHMIPHVWPRELADVSGVCVCVCVCVCVVQGSFQLGVIFWVRVVFLEEETTHKQRQVSKDAQIILCISGVGRNSCFQKKREKSRTDRPGGPRFNKLTLSLLSWLFIASSCVYLFTFFFPLEVDAIHTVLSPCFVMHSFPCLFLSPSTILFSPFLSLVVLEFCVVDNMQHLCCHDPHETCSLGIQRVKDEMVVGWGII